MTWDEVREGDVVTTQGGYICLVLESRMHCRDLHGVPILMINYVDLTDMHKSAWMVYSDAGVLLEILRGDKVIT